MRVVFMGTPAFAVPSLRKLAAALDVALVLTRPDAVRSRGKKLEPSPVKEAALGLGLPVMEANRMRPRCSTPCAPSRPKSSASPPTAASCPMRYSPWPLTAA